MNPAHHDGCTFWIDGWWRSCCDAHDAAYATGTVETHTHIDLGLCVIDTAPTGLALIAVIIGALMTLATKLWWIVRHKRAQD